MSSVKKTEKTSADKDKKVQPKALLDEIKDRGAKITRSYTNEAEKNWREYYLKLSLDEKRKFYMCGSRYVLLDEVKGWPDYAAGIGSKVKRTARPLFDIDETLNMKISLWRGDITSLEIDAICNAANNSLLGGGGVDGAIHRAAGLKMREECASIGRCETGDAKLTGGYKLPAKYIIHTVGPIGEHPKKLSSCYKTCLNLAKKEKIRTIAFPCISTGIYGYDVEKATPVVMTTVRDWLLKGDNNKYIDKIIFCVFLINDVATYEQFLLQYFPVDKYTEIPEKKKPKTKDSAKSNTEKAKAAKENKKKGENDTKSVDSDTDMEKTEIPEKKKPKTIDSAKSNTEKAKEAKENIKEGENDTKSADLDTDMEKKEIPEKKKPKTIDPAKSNTGKAKEAKYKREDGENDTKSADSGTDIEKKETERNQTDNSSAKVGSVSV